MASLSNVGRTLLTGLLMYGDHHFLCVTKHRDEASPADSPDCDCGLAELVALGRKAFSAPTPPAAPAERGA